jgi:bacterioferritin
MDKKQRPVGEPDIVDEASDESFPASDPPSWTATQRAGAPWKRPPTEDVSEEQTISQPTRRRTMAVQTQKGNGRTSPANESKGSITRETMIEGLNHDLAGEYQAVLMYTHFAAKLTGPYRKELRALFQAEITDELGHAQFLADKVATLGGEPTTEPRAVPHADEPREMLEQALATEIQAITDYTERIEQAEAFGDVGLKVDLENQVADETRHKEDMERILAGWDR